MEHVRLRGDARSGCDCGCGDDAADTEVAVERERADCGDREVSGPNRGRDPRTLEAEERPCHQQEEAVERKREREPEQRRRHEVGRPSAELAALVDEADHRLRQHEDRRRGGNEEEDDQPHPAGHRRAQVVELLAGGVARERREEHGRNRDREDPLREHVDPKRLVDRRGRLRRDEEAGGAVDQQVEVDQPEADRHRQHQDQHAADVDVAKRLADSPSEWRDQRRADSVRRVAQVDHQDRELEERADEHADRVRVDLVVLRETPAQARRGRR